MIACLGTGMAVNCNSLGARIVEESGWVRRQEDNMDFEMHNTYL